MRKPILFALLALAATVAMAEAAETRCGWLQNPTPANWWLDDSEGSWTLMTQGAGEEPAGFDRIPDISAGDYVRTNGNYGYACACMKVETDAAEGRITAIHSVRQLPISQCANDTALPAVE
ncbi:DUF4087 domain-containing protein [Shinella yambaruensis]|uniref:DUF4087 domain-containing protein n=1 Tax=Shinella yambaruensis TaxID=415996 RepID=A0ABQ5ZPG3_9HYPH|nr:DUF4087 domain-containing protein [Shinella yambaruensis]MCJ8025220.1 DUF4087 domain-containing protein [Shinella yambaruensis]MCU7981146.1 DUF4087 domain-containing protein [Shinella yambaruensis]GLR53712.1 hypothetical protein GCM10007923_49280 [Shinella yambaruensis]